jgi:hypothetical protein
LVLVAILESFRAASTEVGQRKPHPRASRDESAAAAANGRQKSLKSPALTGPITLVIEWASVSLHWRVLLARYLDLTN